MANDLLIRLLLKDEATKKITTVEGQLVHLSNTAKQVYGAIAGSAAIAAIGVFMKQSVDAAMQEEDALNRLNAAMELQGTYSERLSLAYKGLAESLQRNSRFADEAIMSVMQTLVTLGDVAPANMQRVTQAVLDFSAATRKDLQASSEIIAKAAQGSIMAFSKLGVTFTKTMTDAEKFERVLLFIEARMGGMAQKDINTYAGATSQLANEWNNFQEELGKFITQNPEIISGVKLATRAVEDMAASLKAIREESNKQGFGAGLLEFWRRTSVLGALMGRVEPAKVPGDESVNLSSGQITNEQRLKEESDFWMAKAQISIQGEEIIRSIQSQYGSATKDMILQDKLFFVQSETEKINIILQTANIDKATQESLHNRKT
ncbi:MAG: hypothetical protein Q8R48_08080 [Candidatus Omnitrophota bacterium]|nr:hypothetical protein [Candidatus Omnitrophota bacterium]